MQTRPDRVLLEDDGSLRLLTELSRFVWSWYHSMGEISHAQHRLSVLARQLQKHRLSAKKLLQCISLACKTSCMQFAACHACRFDHGLTVLLLKRQTTIFV